MKKLRKILMVGSIILTGTAISVPDITLAKLLGAFGTSLGLAAAYLKEEE